MRYNIGEAKYRDFKEGNLVERISIFLIWMGGVNGVIAILGLPVFTRSSLKIPAGLGLAAFTLLFGIVYVNGYWNLYQGRTWFGEESVEGDAGGE